MRMMEADFSLEDFSLMEDARTMDREALIAIFDRFAVPLYNFAMRLCGDPIKADQAVGDVFTKFLEQLAAGKGPRTNLRSYLYEMMRNLLVDGFRRSRREVPLELTESELERENAPRSMDSNLENKLVMDALILAIKGKLTADQRHVIVLRFAEGFSLLETAQIVGKAAGTVKVTQNRAIAKLRKVLSGSEVNA
jgi:RNA polymerase sigma-70 factor, ECF subfamily